MRRARFLRRSSEVESAEQSRDDQSHTCHRHDGRETIARTQIRRVDSPLRSMRVALDDNLSIEITVRVQPFGQTNADQKQADQAKASKPQEGKQQHRNHAEKEDRQQRYQQQYLRLSSHRATNPDNRKGGIIVPACARKQAESAQFEQDTSPPPCRRGFRRAARRSASIRPWFRHARRSSRCRPPHLARPRRCGGSSRPCRRA
jgi:hypothetical protein